MGTELRILVPVNDLTGLVAGPGEGVTAGTYITRGCVGEDALLREYGLSACAYVSILYLCKMLGRV